MHIIWGLLIMAAGSFLIIKTESMLSFFGRIEFFERYLGVEGGSRLGYKLVGILTLFIGLLIMTNMISGFLTWLLGPLLKYNQPNS